MKSTKRTWVLYTQLDYMNRWPSLSRKSNDEPISPAPTSGVRLLPIFPLRLFLCLDTKDLMGETNRTLFFSPFSKVRNPEIVNAPQEEEKLIYLFN